MARRKDPLTEPAADALQPAPMPGPEALPEPPPPEPPAPEPPPPPPPARRAGLLGPVLGGAVAAILGFGLSHFDAFGLAPPDPSPALEALAGRVAALEGQAPPAPDPALTAELQALATRVAALEAAPPPEAPDLSGLDDLDRRLRAIEALPAGGEASTAALAAKLADLERQLAARPAVDQTDVDTALARLEAAEAEAARRAEAAEAALLAARRAEAMEALGLAIRSGAAFEAELAALSDPALSAALQPYAGGVSTLAGLQADFPAAARAVLELARAGAQPDGWGARLWAFLADQTGARPVVPLEGDTPEAILSRAEARLAVGKPAEALMELSALDPALLPPIADWTARAEAHVAALAALEAP